MFDLIGWTGALFLSICGLPQAIHSIKVKNADGISWGFLFLWTFGEIFQLIYVINLLNYPIIFNCLLNLVFCSIILFYKIKK